MRRSSAVGIVMCLVVAAVVAIQLPAFASCTTGGTLFKAHDSTSCGDANPLLESNSSAGSTVSVARDKTSSAKNATTNKWCFVNEGINDQTIFILTHTSAANTLGDANNATDHFDVVSSGSGCPA